MWSYSQSRGELLHNDEHVAFGYSGADAGKNNPAYQNVHNVGPIPQGLYVIEPIDGDYEGKKAPVLRLVPNSENQMFGRDGFLIHGDSASNPGTASQGCIIMAHWVREQIGSSGDDDLMVTI
jgi:hypothetical protein